VAAVPSEEIGGAAFVGQAGTYRQTKGRKRTAGQGVLRRVDSLSREEQDLIAAQIIETLDDEEAWGRRFRDQPAALGSLAREALDEHRRGETRPLDELIG